MKKPTTCSREPCALRGVSEEEGGMQDTRNETEAPHISSAAEIVNAANQLGNYDYGRPMAPLRAIDKLINATYGQREPRQRIETELVKLLEADTSFAVKQFVCQKLSIIGTDLSVPALGRLLGKPDAHLVEAACYTLSRHRSPGGRPTAAQCIGQRRWGRTGSGHQCSRRPAGHGGRRKDRQTCIGRGRRRRRVRRRRAR